LSQTKDKFSKILVGIDGSQLSKDAAGYAIQIAKIDNAELIVIHVLSAKLGGYEHTPKPLLFGLPATPSSVNNIIETSEKEAQRWLARIKQQLLTDDENIGVKIRTEVIIASTARIAAEIVDYGQQQNVDLIVVGTKGRSGFKRLLLGSVASGVVTYAHCPVLVVK
jgi:nucleotide-binding universal stress UspA family protein